MSIRNKMIPLSVFQPVRSSNEVALQSERSSEYTLQVYLKGHINEGQKVLVSDSNITGLSAQEVYARLCYNRLYVSTSVTDSVDGEFYKHQSLVGRQMFQNDSAFVMHDPGTGKTITYLYTMMELLRARVITKFLIINYSTAGNKVAERSLKTIYEKRYIQDFRMTFNQFWNSHVKTTTLHKLATYPYESYMGIVIDEAHNMLSDNEPGTNKVVNVGQFTRRLSLLSGVKLMLLTATPLQGDTASLGKFRSILFRNPDEREQFIPPSLISYTQINYTHLRVKQMLNEDDPIAKVRGDRSFELSNGAEYSFYLYCQKPSPMQIADFAMLAITNERAPFQSKEKPRIVSSLPRERMIDGPNGAIKTKVAQSAIVESIANLADKTRDGTIIVYCDLVEDGSKATARYLDQHGWEKYSARDPGSKGNKQIGSQYRGKIKELETELAEKSSHMRELTSDLIETNEEEIESLKEQLQNFQGYQRVKETLAAYLAYYEEEHKRNQQLQDNIAELSVDCVTLREEIAYLKSQRVGTRDNSSSNSTPGRRYMIYSSSMSAQDNDAFKLFNSEANWDGKLIKMIIGSKVMRDGVDIFHAVQTHIIIPEWRISGFIQAQHRGIRSAGHNHLIHHRAIRMVEEQKNDPDIPHNNKITYKQAREYIIKEKVTIEIYNHFVDMELLTLDDIEEAREFIDENDDLANMDDETILQLLKGGGTKGKAGEAIVNAAIDKYRDVGAEMMTLRSSALDYKLNVKRENRLANAVDTEEHARQLVVYNDGDLLAKKDTELFFSQDYTETIIREITDLLLDYSYGYTDAIFAFLMEPQEPVPTIQHEIAGEPLTHVQDTRIYPNEFMIATAINELVEHRRRVYNERLGIWMYVKLWETEEESILYLCATDNQMNIHPLNAFAATIGFSASSQIERVMTRITQADLLIPKPVKTFYKLKDLIKKAADGGTVTQVELTFLIQMSNYWALSWKDLANPAVQHDNISVYVLEDHITRPSMNNLARDLCIHEYRVATKEWHVTSTMSLKDTLLVRYATLVDLYRRFSFFQLPEFFTRATQTLNDGQDTNGIIFIKGYYNPKPNADDWMEHLLMGENVFLAPAAKNVLVKEYMSARSRGKQIMHSMPGKYGDRDQVLGKIREIIDRDITLFFFLYDRDTSIRGSAFTIYDIKRAELGVMLQAVNGTPTPRFQIYAVERKVQDPVRKRQIYREIYKLPSFL